MRNLGNIGGTIFLTYPPCWDETWVCDECKILTKVTKHGELPGLEDYSYLKDYKEI